ncbi:TetR family transcriptional regulator [Paractinoplanes abujensis]|uniref:AcrR family transcriptional regulator n=1 Tax=Paractinoplanes abujensis TaxID=882441 RepID=A0A7W7G1W9_9ACTN|nr:TetR/AcrR family transcriptional regulator [Actinoplanes abujensis]MBB4694628.1 AcrR family transcriptional regulator [Actinoplanes abujensis]GID20158.1 TetR family transcriptional regulator [Actinoplanes abujensis]
MPPVKDRPADKFDRRRDELAESALLTLGELGYARASLREIAGNSPFSHGVVHYYFSDKTELVVYSVRHYKARCVTRYDAVVSDSTTPEELVEAFAAKLAQTIRDEAPMHRLWYDLRTQSMFEESLREAITEIDGTLQAMIWRVVDRYATLSGTRPSVPAPTAYAMLDGLFQAALLAHSTTGEPILDDLAAQVRTVMPLLVSAGPVAQDPSR